MTTRIWLRDMTVQDQDQIHAWCADFVPNDGGSTLVRSMWADQSGILHCTIYRLRDGNPYVDPDTGEPAVLDVQVPEKWAATFPVMIGPNAGITAVETEATNRKDPPRDVRP